MIATATSPDAQVVVLTQDASTLPGAPPWAAWAPEPQRQVLVWSGTRPLRPALGVPPAGVRSVDGGYRHSWRDAVRVPLAWGRCRLLARRHGLDPAWLWQLKRSQPLASALRRSTAVIPGDEQTQRILLQVPGLAREAQVLHPADVLADGPVWRQPREWERLLGEIEDVLDETAYPPGDPELDRWTRRVADAGPGPVPLHPRLLLDRTEALARGLRGASGREWVRPLLDRVLRPLCASVPGEQWRCEAIRVAIGLWSGETGPDDQQLRAVVTRSLGGADAAADRPIALGRLHDGMDVLLHRVRHSETVSSPLVQDPDGELAALRACHTWVQLRDGSARRPGSRLPRHRRGAGPPRVLVLVGAYGAFQQDLVSALEPAARVRVCDLPGMRAGFRRRRPREVELRVLDALRRGRLKPARLAWPAREHAGTAGRKRATRAAELTEDLAVLVRQLRWADVVVSDWVDAATMWASHLAPPGVRVVTRAHSLDLLDPWLHLVDWRGVDRVLISNDGFRSLYTDLVAGTGAPEAEQVRPYLPHLLDVEHEKDPATRHTIGMVGWGRPVKGLDRVLDLVEADPRRRLVLIGPGFPPGSSGQLAGYRDAVLARLEALALRDRVEVVGATDDVQAHLRRVGVILSASTREGWHLGLIEGAASGAVPIVLDWPLLAARGGARSLYPDPWVVAGVPEADARLAELADPEVFRAASEAAHQQMRAAFDPASAAERYRELVLGDLDQAGAGGG